MTDKTDAKFIAECEADFAMMAAGGAVGYLRIESNLEEAIKRLKRLHAEFEQYKEDSHWDVIEREEKRDL
jgi:hypothetical protein